MSDPLLLLEAFVTAALTGLIWVVQRVHYPLFIHVPEEGYEAFQEGHVRRITPVVAPLMLVEVALAASGLWRSGDTDPLRLAAGLLLAVIWGVTFLRMVPLHARLERGRDAEALASLVRWNWWRTAAWTGRLFLVGALLLDSN